MSEYEVFQGKDKQWYWHLIADNGAITSISEGYVTKQNAKRGARGNYLNTINSGGTIVVRE